MKHIGLAVVALAVALGSGSLAETRRVHGECTNARTAYHHTFTFVGRFRASAGTLRGRVIGAGQCPHGRLQASCTPSGTFYNCHGTVGHCQIDGPYYGMFPAAYTCPGGTVGAFGW